MKRISIAQTPTTIGEKIKVAGWVATKRDHGKITFIDLRDVSGILQVVFSPEQKKIGAEIRPEWVLEITGTITKRPKSMENPDLATGSVELKAENVHVLSEAKTPPFALHTDGYEIDEEKRLRYRYLDLRRPRLQTNLKVRNLVIQFMRSYLSDRGFMEIETPLLTKSTPEGARDFLVPSRLSPGKFYALPQSPQQYKQLLQVAGFEKYFQIARALRDEDPRGDRQAEHTQLDIEMSFVEKDDILNLIEQLYIELVNKLFPKKNITNIPFKRYTYAEVMKKYKTDKPDLRKDKKNNDELAFVFVTDFPAFEKNATTKKLEAMHNPFSRPQTNDVKAMKKNPDAVLSEQYDLVLNGWELASGSLRATTPEMLQAVFEIIGYTKKEIKENFGHMLEAFTYGVPPHGGIASGIDRFLAIMLSEPNIREVMAFPKTGDNRDLMMDSPSEVSEKQLKELHLKLKKKKQ